MHEAINVKVLIGPKEFYFTCKRVIREGIHEMKTPEAVANWIKPQLSKP